MQPPPPVNYNDYYYYFWCSTWCPCTRICVHYTTPHRIYSPTCYYGQLYWIANAQKWNQHDADADAIYAYNNTRVHGACVCVWVIGCMVSPVRRDRTLAICMHNWEKGRTTRGMQFAIFTRPFHSMISEIVHQYWMVVIVFWVSACVRLCAAASNFRI